LLHVLAFACILLLAAKDLAPTFPVSGEAERRAALGVSALTWPANARNPALGLAAAHVAALFMALALVTLLADRLAGSPRRNFTALHLLAWVLTAFGFAVMVGTEPDRAYGPGNCIGHMVNKNGAGTLIAIGIIVHGGLARAAWRRQAIILAATHLVVMGSLLAPFLRLGSRTALLALGAGAATHLWLVTRPGLGRWREAALALGVAGATALVTATLDERLASRISAVAGDGRWSIWRDSIALARAYPLFGVGLGAFESVYPLHGSIPLGLNERLTHPDSSWIALLLEWGALPFTALILVGGWAGWRHLRFLRRYARHDSAEPGVIAASAVAAWLSAGLTDVTLHRPQSLLLGAVLMGIVAAHPTPASIRPRSRVAAFATAAVILSLGGVLAAWAARPARQELRWSLLDPARLWRAAMEGGLEQGPDSAQLARLHAAVRLQHNAASYPDGAARSLHEHSPAAAFSFWQLTLRRAGSRTAEYFERALKDFPATPPAYWAQLAATTEPDLTLLIPTLPPGDSARAIQAWLARERPQPVSPASAYPLLAAVQRAGRADLLLPALGGLEVADASFWEKVARLLHEQGLAAPAWSAVARALPKAVESPAGQMAGSAALGPDTLLQLGRYTDLRATLLGLRGTGRSALLEKICAQPGAPAWFHFESAREFALAGDFDAATERALVGLSGTPRN
jgi:hypothetical protein